MVTGRGRGTSRLVFDGPQDLLHHGEAQADFLEHDFVRRHRRWGLGEKGGEIVLRYNLMIEQQLGVDRLALLVRAPRGVEQPIHPAPRPAPKLGNSGDGKFWHRAIARGAHLCYSGAPVKGAVALWWEWLLPGTRTPHRRDHA